MSAVELTRADLPVNLTYLATLCAPVVSLISFRLARRRRYLQHRAVQLLLLALCWLTVLAFEINLRLSGGSGAFLHATPASLRGYAKALLLLHISAAVLTYAAWSWLAIVSQRHFPKQLPGAFSLQHRRFGKLVWSGLCFTAASATGMYLLAFVL